MIESAVILPTGDEIRSGIVLDTDSPETMAQLLRLNPCMQVSRYAPVPDEEEAIRHAVSVAAGRAELIILIGGSGGGRRFSGTLSWDFTHTVLEQMLSPYSSRQLFGKNGHLWCNMVCGMLGNSLVINLPGPFVEAQAAMSAFCRTVETEDIEVINTAMSEAVRSQYPSAAANE